MLKSNPADAQLKKLLLGLGSQIETPNYDSLAVDQKKVVESVCDPILQREGVLGLAPIIYEFASAGLKSNVEMLPEDLGYDVESFTQGYKRGIQDLSVYLAKQKGL